MNFKSHHITKKSYGIILFYFDLKSQKNKFLLVCRKDSLEYVQLIRGNYSKSNHEKLQSMFNLMTIDEINNLKTLSFQQLWEKLWMKTIKQDNYRIDYKKNYENALNKFNKIKESGLLTKFINNYSGCWTEPEWGLPKGRKNYEESNI